MSELKEPTDVEIFDRTAPKDKSEVGGILYELELDELLDYYQTLNEVYQSQPTPELKAEMKDIAEILYSHYQVDKEILDIIVIPKTTEDILFENAKKVD